MEKFYVIKLINIRNGERGYVIDRKDGIMLSLNGLSPDVTMFENEIDARIFIKNKRLERQGMTAHIRSNEDLMVEEKGTNVRPADKDLFYIENSVGEKLFYDSKEDGYYFKYGDVGYPVWYSEEDTKKFIEAYKLEDVIIKLTDKNKK